MSKQVDQKVVQMQFDNQQFEKGVNESMASIDKLKKNLNFENTAKGLEGLNNAVKGVTLDSLTHNVNRSTEAFNALQLAASIALGNIITQAAEAGLQLAKSLSIDQVSKGWEKYAQETESVQTIMNATGKSIEEVEAQLARLSWFADETSYSYVDMTSNVGKFTSQSIDLESAVTEMQGISTWAAVSGSNVAQASRAMYNLSQSLGLGAVRVQDWMSIENANMATAQFKQTAMDAAVAVGSLTKEGERYFVSANKKIEVTTQNFRSTLQENWLNNEALEKTLYKYGHFTDVLYQEIQTLNEKAGDDLDLTASKMLQAIDLYDGTTESIKKFAAAEGINVDMLADSLTKLSAEELEFGKKAFKAAQEAKTFQEAIDATKDAVSSQWKDIFKIIFGNYEQAKVLWTDLANYLYDLFTEDLWDIKAVLQEWSDLGGRTEFLDAMYSLFDNLATIIGVVRESLAEVFPFTGKNLYDLTVRFKDFAKSLELNEDKLARLKGTLSGFFSIFKIGFNVIKTVFDYVSPILTNIIFPVLSGILDVIFTISSRIGSLITTLQKASGSIKALKTGAEKWVAILKPIKEDINGFFDNIVEKIEVFFMTITHAAHFIKSLGVEGFIDYILNTIAASSKAGQTFVNILRSIVDWFKNIGEVCKNVFKNIKSAFQSVKIANPFDNMDPQTEKLLERLKVLKNSFSQFFTSIKNSTFAKDLGKIFKDASFEIENFSLIGILSGILNKILDIGHAIYDFLYPILSKLWEIIKKVSKELFNFITEVLDGVNIGTVIGAAGIGGIVGIFLKLKSALEAVKGVKEIKEGFVGILNSIKDVFVQYQNNIKADVVEKIAKAIGILTLSLIGISLIDYDALLVGVTVITAFVGGLVYVMNQLGSITPAKGIGGLNNILNGFSDTINKNLKISSLTTNLIKIAAALLIFAEAIKVLGNLEWYEMLQGLAGVAAELTMLGVFLDNISKIDIDTKKLSTQAIFFIELGAALLILTTSVKSLALLDFGSMLQGLLGLGLVMAEIQLFAKSLEKLNTNKLYSSLLQLDLAVLALSGVCAILTIIPWESVKKAAALMGSLTICMSVLSMCFGKDNAENIKAMNDSMIKFAAVVAILSATLLIFNSIDWGTLGRAGTAFGAFMVALFVGSYLSNSLKLAEALDGLSKVVVKFGLGIVEIGVGFLAFAAAAKVLEGAIKTLPAVFSAIGTAIVALIESLVGSTFTIADFLSDIIFNLIESLIKKILTKMSSINQQFYEIFLQTVDFLGEKLPEIVDKLLSLIIKLLDSLKGKVSTVVDKALEVVDEILAAIGNHIGNMGLLEAFGIELFIASMGVLIKVLAKLKPDVKDAAIVAALIVGLTASMAAIIVALNALDVNNSLEISASLVMLVGGMAAVIGVLSTLNVNIATAVNAALALVAASAIIVGGFAAILLIIEGIFALISKIEGAKEFFQNGIDLMVMMAEGLGRAFGSLVDGFLNAATKSIPEIGTRLSDFMTNLTPFLDGIRSLGENEVNAAKALAEIILALSVAEFMDGITKLITFGGSGFENLGTELSSFADAIVEFSQKVKELEPDVLVKTALAAAAGKNLAEVAAVIPREGGVLQDLIGVKDLESFGEKVKSFVTAIISTSDILLGSSVGPETADKFTLVAQAGQSMAEIAKSIPQSGGIWQKIVGEKDIESFGKKTKKFISSIVDANTTLSSSNLNQQTITLFGYAVQAGQQISQLANEMPKSGGIWQKIVGENDLADFGEKIKTYGETLVDFSNKISGIKVSSVLTGVTLISQMAAIKIPESDGLISGGIDAVTFSNAIGEFGNGLSRFYINISDINLKEVQLAILELTNIAAFLSNMNATDFSSANNFAQTLKNLGEASALDFTRALQAKVSDVMRASQQLYSAVIETLKPIPSEVNSYGVEAMNNFTGALRNSIPSIKQATNVIKQTLKSILSDINADFKKAGESSINAFSKAIESKSSDVSKKAKSIGVSAAGQISNYSGSYTSGQNFALGFINGLASYEYGIKNAAFWAGVAAVSSLNAGIKAASPSKATRQSGNWFGEGFINGMVDEFKSIKNTANEMGEISVDAISNVVEKVADVLDSEVDVNPVITPVLDLSNVQNGIGLLNGTIANSNYRLGSLSGALAGSLLFSGVHGVEGNTYNDSNVLVAIDTLGSRVDSLNDAISKMRVVLDSGEVVGGISNKMNKRFGEMEFAVARGVR